MRSPFAQHRWEHEGRHVYYLPPKVMNQLERPTPTYLIGTRGTGKTTLLRAMTWSERMSNTSLRLQIGDDPFGQRYIGVYFKLPKIQLSLFERWLADSDPDLCADVMGLYLDLNIVELIAQALDEMGAGGRLLFDPQDELRVVQTAMASYADYPTFSGVATRSLGELTHVIRSKRRQLVQFARSRRHSDFVVANYPVERVGTLATNFASCLAQLLRLSETANATPDTADEWRFYACMDEGETLSSFQQLTINTLVRLVEAPLFPTIAFVGIPEDITTTLEPHLFLQKADRQVIVLDNMKDPEFEDFAGGVATARVRDMLGDDQTEVNVRWLLGDLDVNGLLHESLKRSVNPKARGLLERARAATKEPFFSVVEKRREKPPPPIYETFLIEQLDLQLPRPEEPAWERRRQGSQELRKRNVAAYLAICTEFGLAIRYASADMLFQMCDRCVRDFIWQMEEVFVEQDLQLNQFLERKVSSAKQNRALQRASRQKMQRVGKFLRTEPAETFRIIHGLAQLTARLQTRGRADRNLRSPERGKFVLRDSGQDTGPTSTFEQIRDAAQAGYMRLLGTEDEEWIFRIHTSLAAAYGFSYRGAYYKSRLEEEDLKSLREARADQDVMAVVTRIADRLDGTIEEEAESQLELFLEDS